MIIDEPEGATPLDPDDMEGLKHPHVTTREQLNELEQSNILAGQQWVSGISGLTLDSIFSVEFVFALHQNLFGDVWAWAGTSRKKELNIGCDPSLIRHNLYNFLEDAKYWVTFKHFSHLELSARIQHKLVEIHPFPNGNGRHSRIFTDVVRIVLLEEPPLNWAEGNLERVSEERKAYISCLKEADKGDFAPFVKYLENLGN
ncbi:mobile mystery protein B [Shewanella baltica]|uniref:Mobile mystery protein B n=1 Tax=Shewanella baltica (strain OS155 / ATCC BAA-1091) TaxID=325240 RepID=A3D2Y2_SHEB5|nr:mobile mystery protein B [Shewanella baltica]ABN61095.1 mobile mystery protein B [Shewanella baltica OS155]AEH13445.1 mobile mystery protein B [Shewanella baltica OS117]